MEQRQRSRSRRPPCRNRPRSEPSPERSVAIRQLGTLAARTHHERRARCPHEIAIARLPGRADPGVTGFPPMHLATSRAAQRHCDARQALEQNPFGLEAGRNRSARARALNQNISQGRAPSMIGDTRRSRAGHANRMARTQIAPAFVAPYSRRQDSRRRRTAAELQLRFMDDSLPKRCRSSSGIFRTVDNSRLAGARRAGSRRAAAQNIADRHRRVMCRI